MGIYYILYCNKMKIDTHVITADKYVSIITRGNRILHLKPEWKEVSMAAHDIPEILTSRGFDSFDTHALTHEGNSVLTKGNKIIHMKPWWKEVALDVHDIPEILTSRGFDSFDTHEILPDGNSVLTKGNKIIHMKPWWTEVAMDVHEIPEILTSRGFDSFDTHALYKEKHTFTSDKWMSVLTKGDKIIIMGPWWKEVKKDTHEMPDIVNF